MEIGYYAENIRKNINAVRNKTGKDISPEVGKILHGFMSYYKNRISDEMFLGFLEITKGLERYLIRKTKKRISLHDIQRSGAEICGILIHKDEKELSSLTRYISGLKGMDLKINGHDQIFP